MNFEGAPKPRKKEDLPVEKYAEIAAVLQQRTANLPPKAANDNEPEFGSEDLGTTVQDILKRNQG